MDGLRSSFAWLGAKVVDETIKPTGFERHAQTVIGAILLALLLWTGSALIDVRDRLGRIEVYQINASTQDAALGRDMADLRNRVRDLEINEARRATK